jgi:hypothetical protein
MKTELQLPAPIKQYLEAINSHDPDALQRCFAHDAVVKDLKHEYHGSTEIRSWADREIFSVNVTLDLRTVREADGRTILTVEVDGSFDRTGLPDPLVMEHGLTYSGDLITSLGCQFIEE